MDHLIGRLLVVTCSTTSPSVLCCICPLIWKTTVTINANAPTAGLWALPVALPLQVREQRAALSKVNAGTSAVVCHSAQNVLLISPQMWSALCCCWVSWQMMSLSGIFSEAYIADRAQQISGHCTGHQSNVSEVMKWRRRQYFDSVGVCQSDWLISPALA